MGIQYEKEKLKELDEEIQKVLQECGEITADEYEDDQYDNSIQGQLDYLYNEKEKVQAQIDKYNYYKNLGDIKRNSKYVNFEIEKIFSDECAEEDLMNRSNKAEELAQYICNDAMNGSFNIGITGEWGTGKSTFLNMIKKNISKFKGTKDIYILQYDASTYSEQNQIWANFAKILFEEFEKQKIFSHIRYSLYKLFDNWKQVISRIIFGLVVFIIVFVLRGISDWIMNKDEILGYTSILFSSITGIILVITQIAIPMIRKALDLSIPLSKKILSGFKFPSYIEILGTREKITQELDLLFKVWMPRKEQKIVIFVDELDRCTEKGVCEFFQAIQLFFHTKKIIFIFAIEYSHLEKALANGLNIPNDKIQKSIVQYLDKYVSMIVPMQDYNVSYMDLAEKLIYKINRSGKLTAIEENEIKQIKESFECIPNIYLTPRKIKKMINIFVLSKNYCLNYDKMSKINYSQLFSWIILKCVKPEAAEYILSLYQEEKQYRLLKGILEYPLYQMRLKEKLNDINYIRLIENYSMCDILIYENLSKEFCILS